MTPPAGLRAPAMLNRAPALMTPDVKRPMTEASMNDLELFGAYSPTGRVAKILAMTRRCDAGWLGKRKAFFLRALAVRALRGRPLDVESLGAKMRLYPYNNVCEKRILFTPQYFDPEERALLASRLRDDFTFIDIGANIGGYALSVAALAGPRARILAIEPQPEIFERLAYNMQQNPFGNMKAIACAIADKDGEIILFVDRNNRGETSMRIVTPDARGGQITAPAKTLLALCLEEKYGHLDAIKLDVEGAEDLILEPFYRNAPEHLWPRLLLLEFSHNRWATDLGALLKARGYAEVLRTKGNVAYERTGPGVGPEVGLSV